MTSVCVKTPIFLLTSVSLAKREYLLNLKKLQKVILKNMSDQNRSEVWNKAIVWIGKLYIWRWVLSLNAVYVHVRVRRVHIRKYTIALNSKMESIELSTLSYMHAFSRHSSHIFRVTYVWNFISDHPLHQACYVSIWSVSTYVSVSVQYICQLPIVLSTEEVGCKNGPKLA